MRTHANLTYITPDLCSDGHDEPCVDGRPGGLVSIDRWMRNWIPRILAVAGVRAQRRARDHLRRVRRPAERRQRLLQRAAGTELPDARHRRDGRWQGRRAGDLPWTQPNSRSTTPYNHYSLLASIEDLFGLDHIGFAAQEGLNRFGLDVYNDYRP